MTKIFLTQQLHATSPKTISHPNAPGQVELKLLNAHKNLYATFQGLISHSKLEKLCGTYSLLVKSATSVLLLSLNYNFFAHCTTNFCAPFKSKQPLLIKYHLFVEPMQQLKCSKVTRTLHLIFSWEWGDKTNLVKKSIGFRNRYIFCVKSFRKVERK